MLKIKDIKEALRKSKRTAQPNNPEGERIQIGDWTVWAIRVHSPGVGYAWYWHYHSRHPLDDYDTGGWRTMGELASQITRRERSFVPAKLDRNV